MMLNPNAFIARQKPCWDELAQALDELERGRRMTLDTLKRVHYLYEVTAADLVKLRECVAETELRGFLETLVARAYSEIHESRSRRLRFQPLRWFMSTFPAAFRRHARAFWFSLAVTCAGMLFGGLALTLDPDAKAVLMPMSYLLDHPSQRIAHEETLMGRNMEGEQVRFSAMLMTHNARVAILTMALGMLWGLGTAAMLLFNGVVIGAVIADYLLAGEGVFLLGWLLPHGSIEIPSILIAGQAGFVLAGTLIGCQDRRSVKQRLRDAAPDLSTLIAGVVVLLVWAGLMEGFFSQYHAPVLPYGLKILIGCLELAIVLFFLCLAGRGKQRKRMRP